MRWSILIVAITYHTTDNNELDMSAPTKHRSLLQKSLIKETIFCKRDVYWSLLIVAITYHTTDNNELDMSAL